MVDAAILAIAKSFVRQIPAELGVTKSFLFGSYAKGNERENIDLDMVVHNMPDFFIPKFSCGKYDQKLIYELSLILYGNRTFTN